MKGCGRVRGWRTGGGGGEHEAVSHNAQNGFSWGVKEDAGTDMKP